MKAIIPVYPEPHMLKTLRDLEGKTFGGKIWEEGFKGNSVYVYPERFRIDESIKDIFKSKEPIRVMSFSFIRPSPGKWCISIIYGKDARPNPSIRGKKPIPKPKERTLIEVRTKYPERRLTGRTY